MITVAIGSYKGGTGKTTSSVNLAYNLAVEGNRVLVIDADPQANSTYMLSNVSNNSKTLNNLFCGSKINSCIRRTRFRGVKLDIIKGSSEIEESLGDPDIIKTALKDIANDYDFCIIDTHPSMQLPTIAAMIAADILLVPFKPDGYGKTGLSILDDYIGQIQSAYNPNLDFYVFVTQYAKHRSQNTVVMDLVEKYNFPVLNTVISNREAVNTSILIRRPLLMHRKKDPVTKDYIELTQELSEICTAKEGQVI